MVDACYYIFVKFHGALNIKSDPKVNPGILFVQV